MPRSGGSPREPRRSPSDTPPSSGAPPSAPLHRSSTDTPPPFSLFDKYPEAWKSFHGGDRCTASEDTAITATASPTARAPSAQRFPQSSSIYAQGTTSSGGQATGYPPDARQTLEEATETWGGQAQGFQYPSYSAATLSGQAPSQSTYNNPSYDYSMPRSPASSGDPTPLNIQRDAYRQFVADRQLEAYRKLEADRQHMYSRDGIRVPTDRNKWAQEDERLIQLAGELRTWDYINTQFLDPPAALRRWQNVLRQQHTNIEVARVRAGLSSQ